MRKPVVVGAGLGVLALALVGGGFWWTTHSPPAPVRELRPVARGPGDARPSAPSVPAAAASAASRPLSAEEVRLRRKRLAEVRTEFNALRAQGAMASPEKMRAMVDELESLSPPGLDPRYFQALRNLLDTNARFQALNNELQALSKNPTPQASARQQEILAEVRVLGDRVTEQARNLQSYAPTSPSGVKSP